MPACTQPETPARAQLGPRQRRRSRGSRSRARFAVRRRGSRRHAIACSPPSGRSRTARSAAWRSPGSAFDLQLHGPAVRSVYASGYSTAALRRPSPAERRPARRHRALKLNSVILPDVIILVRLRGRRQAPSSFSARGSPAGRRNGTGSLPVSGHSPAISAACSVGRQDRHLVIRFARADERRQVDGDFRPECLRGVELNPDPGDVQAGMGAGRRPDSHGRPPPPPTRRRKDGDAMSRT